MRLNICSCFESNLTICSYKVLELILVDSLSLFVFSEVSSLLASLLLSLNLSFLVRFLVSVARFFIVFVLPRIPATSLVFLLGLVFFLLTNFSFFFKIAAQMLRSFSKLALLYHFLLCQIHNLHQSLTSRSSA